MDQFNPSADEHCSPRNSYNVDIDDAGVAVSGLKSQDEKVCKFYLLGRKCSQSIYCKFAHPSPDQMGRYFVETLTRLDSDTTVEFSRNDICAVEITAVINPINFYAHLTPAKIEIVNGKKELVLNETVIEERSQMFLEMQQSYVGKFDRYSYNYPKSLGQLVAAKRSNEGDWCRAKVKDINLMEKFFYVFYVDYGTFEWLAGGSVRDLQPQFNRIPFQAEECALNNLQVNLSGDDEQALEFFRKKTSGKCLYATVVDVIGTRTFLKLCSISSSGCEISINDAMLFKGMATEKPKISTSDCLLDESYYLDNIQPG